MSNKNSSSFISRSGNRKAGLSETNVLSAVTFNHTRTQNRSGNRKAGLNKANVNKNKKFNKKSRSGNRKAGLNKANANKNKKFNKKSRSGNRKAGSNKNVKNKTKHFNPKKCSGKKATGQMYSVKCQYIQDFETILTVSLDEIPSAHRVTPWLSLFLSHILPRLKDLFRCSEEWEHIYTIYMIPSFNTKYSTGTISGKISNAIKRGNFIPDLTNFIEALIIRHYDLLGVVKFLVDHRFRGITKSQKDECDEIVKSSEIVKTILNFQYTIIKQLQKILGGKDSVKPYSMTIDSSEVLNLLKRTNDVSQCYHLLVSDINELVDKCPFVEHDFRYEGGFGPLPETQQKLYEALIKASNKDDVIKAHKTFHTDFKHDSTPGSNGSSPWARYWICLYSNNLHVYTNKESIPLSIPETPQLPYVDMFNLPHLGENDQLVDRFRDIKHVNKYIYGVGDYGHPLTLRNTLNAVRNNIDDIIKRNVIPINDLSMWEQYIFFEKETGDRIFIPKEKFTHSYETGLLPNSFKGIPVSHVYSNLYSWANFLQDLDHVRTGATKDAQTQKKSMIETLQRKRRQIEYLRQVLSIKNDNELYGAHNTFLLGMLHGAYESGAMPMHLLMYIFKKLFHGREKSVRLSSLGFNDERSLFNLSEIFGCYYTDGKKPVDFSLWRVRSSKFLQIKDEIERRFYIAAELNKFFSQLEVGGSLAVDATDRTFGETTWRFVDDLIYVLNAYGKGISVEIINSISPKVLNEDLKLAKVWGIEIVHKSRNYFIITKQHGFEPLPVPTITKEVREESQKAFSTTLSHQMRQGNVQLKPTKRSVPSLKTIEQKFPEKHWKISELMGTEWNKIKYRGFPQFTINSGFCSAICSSIDGIILNMTCKDAEELLKLLGFETRWSAILKNIKGPFSPNDILKTHWNHDLIKGIVKPVPTKQVKRSTSIKKSEYSFNEFNNDILHVIGLQIERHDKSLLNTLKKFKWENLNKFKEGSNAFFQDVLNQKDDDNKFVIKDTLLQRINENFPSSLGIRTPQNT